MLRVDLGQLAREGSVVVEGSLPGDDELWKDTGFSFVGNLDVRLRATYAGTGEVVVRGDSSGMVRQECRRCLDPVETPFQRDLTMVFVSDPTGDEDDGGVYAFEPEGSELDLSEAVREEMILAINPYVVCDPECRGICPKCGANLNEGTCDCTEDEVDPRWEALRDLKSE
jgi:uncharacterized protein